ncbi:SGNH/GDSL hydrolase family protein [Paenibacillus agaridevorans]|uniref:SGNH/GDSL hydrolase family protein n=1 Tax=Paenibacillus agaridevorans TaxID=171404 RepID=UPI001BE44673|nr:SGNH/GDSL hydrolase family protein [Paenibacillus agaridevorans]
MWLLQFSRSADGTTLYQAAYHGIDAFGHEVRPPTSDELPKEAIIAYGSSITQGAGATVHSSSYIQQLGRRTGMDIMNKGLSGSCFCERGMANYLRRAEGWGTALLELGVNMRGRVPLDECEK